jgi:hypothetical protein
MHDIIESPEGYSYFTAEHAYLALFAKREPLSSQEVVPPNNWQSAETLGFGSFGQVLFAYNSHTGETMAVKLERLREIQQEI